MVYRYYRFKYKVEFQFLVCNLTEFKITELQETASTPMISTPIIVIYYSKDLDNYGTNCILMGVVLLDATIIGVEIIGVEGLLCSSF